MEKKDILSLLRSREVHEIFENNNIREAYLIGSYARGENTESSDIDILYARPIGVHFGLMHIGRIKSQLEAKIGKTVDLVSLTGLREIYKNSISKDKILILG